MNKKQINELENFLDYLQDKVDDVYRKETKVAIKKFKNKINKHYSINNLNGMSEERRMLAKARLATSEFTSEIENIDVETKAKRFDYLIEKLGTVLEINENK